MPSPRLALLAASALGGVLLPLWTPAPAALGAAPSLPAGCSQESVGGTVTCTFGYTGSEQTFTVPDGVTSVVLAAWGGHGLGHRGGVGLTPGGRGAAVSGTFAVKPRDNLTVTVGESPQDEADPVGGYGYGHGGAAQSPNGGQEGGGGGGGGTAIADGSTLLLVAGGGGGGAVDPSCDSGAGGDAGQDGHAGVLYGPDWFHGGTNGGAAGAEAGADGGPGGRSVRDDGAVRSRRGGGGGGGGYRGGAGGQALWTAPSGYQIPIDCTTDGNVPYAGAGGGGGGTSYADPSGQDVDLTGLSDRSPRQNGLVRLSYAPGSVAQASVSPADALVSPGDEQEFSVTAYDSGGASVRDVTDQATLSIGPDGSCAGSTCSASTPGPHTVTAVVGDLVATTEMGVKDPPTITSGDRALLESGRDGAFEVDASGYPVPDLAIADGTLPDGLTFSDHHDGTATIEGSSSEEGSVDLQVRASSAAGSVTQTLHLLVGSAPAFTGNERARFTVGVPTTFPIAVSGSPAPSVSLVDGELPDGIALQTLPDGSVALIGTAAGSGSTELTFRADNAFGATTQVVTLESAPAPAFTTEDSVVFRSGDFSSFRVQVSGTPAPVIGIAAGDLPSGLTFTDHGDGTATLAGTPTGTGSTTLRLRASNSWGAVTQTLRVLVGTAPGLTGPDRLTFTHGQEGEATLATTGWPAPSVSLAPGARLPAGLSLVDHGDGTASLAGATSARPGVFVVRLSVANEVGETEHDLTVSVVPAAGGCANRFDGTDGSEHLWGTDGGDLLLGLAGDDQLYGYEGADCLVGGTGRDGLWGDHGADVLGGGPGSDVLRAGRGDDVLRGGPDDDRLVGSYGDDRLVGGPGLDVIIAGPGDDTIDAADGARDVVRCGTGHDTVLADPVDRLVGCERLETTHPRGLIGWFRDGPPGGPPQPPVSDASSSSCHAKVARARPARSGPGMSAATRSAYPSGRSLRR